MYQPTAGEAEPRPERVASTYLYGFTSQTQSHCKSHCQGCRRTNTTFYNLASASEICPHFALVLVGSRLMFYDYVIIMCAHSSYCEWAQMYPPPWERRARAPAPARRGAGGVRYSLLF